MARGGELGFNLIEVTVALGLLAAALISVSGLFVVGARQVASGRNGSLALAAGRTILEEMGRWPLRRCYRAFGYDGAVTTCSADTLTNDFASKWQPLLSPGLATGRATIRLEALGPGSTAPSLRESGAIRVVVTVAWEEGLRHRTLRLVMVKM